MTPDMSLFKERNVDVYRDYPRKLGEKVNAARRLPLIVGEWNIQNQADGLAEIINHITERKLHMKNILWNTGWTVRPGVADPFGTIFGSEPEGKPVTLPHDAMICEERSPDTPSRNQAGFYPAKCYTYEKRFFVPEDWRQLHTVIEFQGVMSKAMVYVNDELAGLNRYGYSQFYVELDKLLKFGQENTLKVVALNFEHASRWYPGSGIYREVYLRQSALCYVEPEGVKLTTQDISDGYAVVLADISLHNGSLDAKRVLVRCALVSPDGKEAAVCENTVSVLAGETVRPHMRLFVDGPRLWSPEEPNLYEYRVTVSEDGAQLDSATGTFGIRTLKLDARNGLRINGREVKLRGACIHHDNGIIGAATLPDAEEFRICKLKEAGFNAIRSAHHPAGSVLLDACDRLGILVMDELTDMWELPKNSGDHSFDFVDGWHDDMVKMVSKDYNHPSVVMYSLGNEIAEIGRRNGGRRNREMAAYLRQLDSTRYITGAINGFLAMTDRLGEMAAQMQEAENRQEEELKAAESAGSEALNAAMSKMARERLNAFATSQGLSESMEEVVCEWDVAGYNYLTDRHEQEHTLHPERVVVGSETFPTDIARLWDIVERNHHVIGDFTWTGYDYVGEAGIAIFHYQPERRDQGWFPDRLAYCGDINLNGYRRPVSYLREIAFGLRREPYIAVERVDKYGQPDNTNDWKYFDAVESWTWNGLEGRPAKVHVLSASDEVELLLNGKSLGRKAAGKAVELDVAFAVEYQPGELTAVGYTNGKEDGRFTLKTAGEPVKLAVNTSKTELSANGMGCAFITVDLVDAEGNPNLWVQKEVSVTVEGPAVLAGFGSADPSCEGSYQDSTWKTFDGRVMAAIRSTTESGEAAVTFHADECQDVTIRLLSK